METSKRDYSGELVTITPTFTLPITLTENHPVLVKRFIKNGKKQILQSHTVGDLEISGGHIRKLWIKAGELLLSDQILIPKCTRIGVPRKYIEFGKYNKMTKGPKANKIPDKVIIDDDLMWLVGLYIAEGWISRQSTLTMNQKTEKEILNKAANIINEKLNLTSRYKSGLSVYHLVVDSKSLGVMLDDMIGSGARNKHLPEFWNSLSDSHLASLIRGCWIGDGTTRGIVKYTTISETLARQIHQALLRFDILSTIKYAEYDNAFRLIIPVKYHDRFFSLMNWKKPSLNEYTGYCRHKSKENKWGFWIGIDKIDRMKYNGPVYNLNIETPNSFNIDGVAIHNCKLAKQHGFPVMVNSRVFCNHESQFTEVGPEGLVTSLRSAGDVS